MKNLFKKKSLIAIFFFTGAIIVMQSIGTKIQNPPITGEIQAPKEVKQILVRSCYSCHSNKTQLQWFDKIAPASWLVRSHVKRARRGMNFTEWNTLTETEKKGKLWELYNFVSAGDMPLKSYLIIHPAAKIEKNDVVVLKKYLLSLVNSKSNDTAKINSFNKQFKQWTTQNISGNLPVVANGIRFIPAYKNWQIISTSERFDSGTMRVIYGNPKAIKAVQDNQTDPWPNGVIMAKAVWTQLKDHNGTIKPGEFKYIQFMIKDDRKYAKTKGWGFARFDSLNLNPFGEKDFEYSCINCHKLVRDHDFVFTRPIKQ